ncbi:histidine kinase [Winogradskyella sp. DF17]|uniref:Histidine kinase n=1 Tax=Winogradskyella pelagia TaxID=2819984 RepID=A0ABS3SZZ2_9FLAO|nr:histidine kinase [Winogradskyella sp. DF17]MBO3116054.1 histidine kinase [Winogradskyella sp. DF17]
MGSIKFTNNSIKEVGFIVALNVVVFIFYAFDKQIPGIEWDQLIFFMNFAIAALFINYFLLPKFLYRNRLAAFTIGVIITVFSVILIEELVLEQIFYPDTRGRRFSNIFYNLLNTLPTLTILTGFKFAWDALLRQKEVNELKGAIKENELQFLKSQINPHFLFNNLNNLYSYAVEKSPKTPELILGLSSLLRYFLYECKTQFVPLEKELGQLKNFVELNQLHIEGRGDVDLIIQNNSQNKKIAPLILMVFIENAFKHSASSVTEEIEIKIVISVGNDGQLVFKCSNNFKSESYLGNLSSGIGLTNVKKRLNLIYPNNHSLDINTENSTYVVNLKLDLSK